MKTQIEFIGRRTGPSVDRANSKQDYQTPREFLDAVEKRFGPIAFDLAASPSNTAAREFYSEADDALSIRWPVNRTLLWLNPPYSDITSWAKKCDAEQLRGCKIVMLVPAGVGANWFADYVHRRALVLALSPRIKFIGAADPYPKDLMLCCWHCGEARFDVWRWK